MDNNFEINKPVDLVSRNEKFLEHIIDLKKLVFPEDFANALEILRLNVPAAAYGELWGKKDKTNDNDLALLNFFNQVDALLVQLHAYIRDHRKLLEYFEVGGYQKPDENNSHLQNSLLLNRELLKVFDKISLFDGPDFIIKNEELLGEMSFDDVVYDKFFIERASDLLGLSQKLLCENWKKLYYLHLSQNEKGIKENLWAGKVLEGFSSPYVLEKNALYLKEKILGQFEFKSSFGGSKTLGKVLNEHSFYFWGYENDVNQDIFKYTKIIENQALPANTLILNKYFGAYGDNNLKWTIQELRPYFSNLVGLNIEQVGALQELADLLADYKMGTYPILDVQVYDLVRDKIKKVFKIEFWV